MEKCICICICILMTMQACGGKNNKVVNAINDNEKETNYYGEVVENNITVEGAKEEVAEEKKTVIGGLVDKGVNAYSWTVNKVSGYVPEQIKTVWNQMPNGVKIAVAILLFNFLRMGINKFSSWKAARAETPEKKKEYASIITGTNDGDADEFLGTDVINHLDNIVDTVKVDGEDTEQIVGKKAKDGLPMNAPDHQFEQMTVFDMDNLEEKAIAEQAQQNYERTLKNKEIKLKTDYVLRNDRRVHIYRQLTRNSRGDLYNGKIPDSIYTHKPGQRQTLRDGIFRENIE